MELNIQVKNDQQFVEAESQELFVKNPSEINSVLETCLSHRINRVLLYSENLSNDFFDLKTGMAGEILQKFRNYGIHVALILNSELNLSTKFRQLMSEENLGNYFRFFSTREAALEWLCSDSQ
jgi:hypothetical protein